MPAFVKDEKAWADAKAAVHKQYPKLTEEDDKFWALCTTIYQKMTGDTEKSLLGGLWLFVRPRRNEKDIVLRKAA